MMLLKNHFAHAVHLTDLVAFALPVRSARAV
jgi:hypothetical protein